MSDPTDLDALGQAELVRRGEVEPVGLLDQAIERLERVNGALNAVVTRMYEQAREAAAGELPDGPFRGVPFLLKDLFTAYAGARLTNGARVCEALVPRYDSELVLRYKRAGLVIFGKTNTPEFGIPPTTENRLFGATRNPWNPARSPGGSSGGAAVVVAARVVPMAHGGDGGGSIRIPASACGVFGLKPTRGRNPLGPDVGDLLSGLVCEHALTLTVRDSAALLDATAGPDSGDPYWAPPPAGRFLDEVGRDPGRLRIGFTTSAPTGVAVDRDCIAAVQEAARLCASLGHEVSEATPAIDATATARGFIALYAAGAARSVLDVEETAGMEGNVRARDLGPLRDGPGAHVRRLPAGASPRPANRPRRREVLRDARHLVDSYIGRAARAARCVRSELRRSADRFLPRCRLRAVHAARQCNRATGDVGAASLERRRAADRRSLRRPIR
jgi:amidase